MKKIIKQTRSLFYAFYLLFLIIAINSSVLIGSNPTIKISSSAVYPRLSLINSEEELHWRNILSYDQEINEKVIIDGLFEYGSENDHFQNPFRVHHFTLNLKLGNQFLKIGRLAVWNALQNARVDGAQLDVKLNKLGVLSLVGGFKAVSDFSDTSFTDNTYFMASWSKGRLGKNLSVSFWLKSDVDNTDPFLGFTHNTSKFGIRMSNAWAFDLNESRLNYAKVRLTKRYGDHTIGLGFRQKRFEYFDYFKSVDDIKIAPTVSLDVNSLISATTLWRNQLSYRIAENGNFFIVSSLNFKKLYASVLSGFERKSTMLGLILGATHRLDGPISFGGSVALNAIDYGDFADLQQATGVYGWIGWQPNDNIMVKLFSRFSNNSYYDQDGRGGIIINVAF